MNLNMDALSASPTPQAKATDFLIDFDMDSISSPASILDAPVPATSIPASNSSSVVDAKDAASAWEACLAASRDKTKYPLVPVIEGPFSEGPLDEFEEMMNEKKNGNHNFGMHLSPLIPYPFFPFLPTQLSYFLPQNCYFKSLNSKY